MALIQDANGQWHTDKGYPVQIVANADGSSVGGGATSAAGDVADNAADSGNPVKIGGVYNTSAPTLDNGDRGNLQVDVNGNLKIVAGAGEVWSFTSGVASVGGNIKNSAGYVQSVTAVNANAAVRYLQLHNKASAASNGEVPVVAFAIPIGQSIVVGANYFGDNGRAFSAGISIAISTTLATYTAATAADHCWDIGWV